MGKNLEVFKQKHQIRAPSHEILLGLCRQKHTTVKQIFQNLLHCYLFEFLNKLTQNMIMLFVFAFSKYSMVNNFTGEFASRQQILSKHNKILFITEFQIIGTIFYCLRLLSFWISEPEQAMLQETERKTVPDEDPCVVNSSYLQLSKNPLVL